MRKLYHGNSNEYLIYIPADGSVPSESNYGRIEVTTDEEIRRGLALVDIPGRFQVMPGQPTIILDVGHNPHAAGHLVANLGNMAITPKRTPCSA